MSGLNTTMLDCMTAPENARSDAGVAGAGILLAFMITAGLALLLSSFIVFGEIRPTSNSGPRTISRKILNGFSDQMLIEGIAVQVVGLAKVKTMIPYHFFLIWMLSLLSTATNFATLLALVQDFKRDWVLRWVRQFAMFVNLVLTIVLGVFVLETNLQDLSPTLPIFCVWEDHAKSENGQGNQTLSVVGTIAVMAASCIIFVLGTWYLHMRRQRWAAWVRCIGLLALMAMAIGAAARVIMVSQAFGKPSVALADQGEIEWSFGQLLTMLLLILPFISALEILRGQIGAPQTTLTSDDQIPLTESAQQKNRYTYQNNPFFGS